MKAVQLYTRKVQLYTRVQLYTSKYNYISLLYNILLNISLLYNSLNNNSLFNKNLHQKIDALFNPCHPVKCLINKRGIAGLWWSRKCSLYAPGGIQPPGSFTTLI